MVNAKESRKGKNNREFRAIRLGGSTAIKCGCLNEVRLMRVTAGRH